MKKRRSIDVFASILQRPYELISGAEKVMEMGPFDGVVDFLFLVVADTIKQKDFVY